MKLTEAQVETITSNIEKFTFTDFNGKEAQCKNIAVAPDNIRITEAGPHLVITCDTETSSSIACYVNFDPETMDVSGIMDEYQVDCLIDERQHDGKVN